MKKILCALLSLVMIMSLLSVGAAVSAAPAKETDDRVVVKVVAGEKASIPFYVNAYGCSGSFDLDNAGLFSGDLTVAESNGTVDVGQKSFSFHSANKDIKGFTLSGTVKSSAKVGDKCEFTVTYTSVVNFPEKTEGLVKKIVVEVIKKDTPTTSSTTSTTQKPSTPTKRPTSATQKPGTNLNKAELNRQISIAESLIKTDYTYDSWAVMESALKTARAALYATTQREIDQAALALKNAIAALVKIDGAALRELLAMVREFLAEDDLASIWGELLSAIEEAEAALVSGDQARINAAYDALKAAFEAFKAKIAALGEDKIVIQEVEKAAECDEACHKWSTHLLWLILLIISAVLNVGFAVLVILYFIKRKKNAADNTPLVDYNINDD